MRQIPVKIWLPIILAAAIAVSLAIYFTFPREEKTPEVSIPEKTPTAEEEITPPEGIVWNVPEGQVDLALEKEIKETIYNDRGFITMAKDLKEKGQFVSIEELNIESEWAVIGTAARFEGTGKYIGTEGVTFLLRKVNQTWQMAVAGDEQFCQWLPLTPDSLISKENKEFYQMFCP